MKDDNVMESARFHCFHSTPVTLSSKWVLWRSWLSDETVLSTQSMIPLQVHCTFPKARFGGGWPYQ